MRESEYRAVKRDLKKKTYSLLQWTWGLPQTLAGAALYAVHRKDVHYGFRGACVTEWQKNEGISLGKFIFVPAGRAAAYAQKTKEADFLLEHEYGHTLQSLILGPAYLLLVGAPSIVWNRLPYFRNKRKKTGKSYYSPVFESSASRLGKRNTLR